MKLSEIGEFGLIKRLTNKIAYSRHVIMGIGDDAAVLEPTKDEKYLLITTDMLVEDVHFSFKYSAPEDIGYKVLAVNISDIAAMGGMPTNCTISIAIPSYVSVDTLEGIYKGLNMIAMDYGINIVGGDTVKTTGPLAINLTLLGEVNRDNVKFRAGAKINDLIGVTGTLGGSAAGLRYLTDKDRNSSIYRQITAESIKKAVNFHLYPIPQIKAANILSQFDKVNSINDISDGLASELHEISSASRTGFIINHEKLPIDSATIEIARLNNISPLEWVLYGGEDYQLVFTCDPSLKEEIQVRFYKEGLKVNFIGKVVESDIFRLEDNEGKVDEIYPKGYNHFT